jgi:hypothetical protein
MSKSEVLFGAAQLDKIETIVSPNRRRRGRRDNWPAVARLTNEALADSVPATYNACGDGFSVGWRHGIAGLPAATDAISLIFLLIYSRPLCVRSDGGP